MKYFSHLEPIYSEETAWMGHRFDVLVTQEMCREESLHSFNRAPRELTELVQSPLLSVAEIPTHSEGAGSPSVFVKCMLIIPRFLMQRWLLYYFISLFSELTVLLICWAELPVFLHDAYIQSAFSFSCLFRWGFPSAYYICEIAGDTYGSSPFLFFVSEEKYTQHRTALEKSSKSLYAVMCCSNKCILVHIEQHKYVNVLHHVYLHILPSFIFLHCIHKVTYIW